MQQKAGKILVTGGCGYIGSHVCCQLAEAGYEVVVLDDLSTGHRQALLHGEQLVEGSCGDKHLLAELFSQYPIHAIMHFAASIIVPESLEKPLEYYQNNVANTLVLLEAAKQHGVKHFILSSSAAIYGQSREQKPLSEEAPNEPLHPYGRSKLMDEWMLQDLAAICPLTYVVLRYFNVAGADKQLRIGQSSPQSSHLIKIACEVAVGKRASLSIYGQDYPTPDGTCIRDYVHVEDLAAAHLAALAYLEKGGESTALNCGYNRGYSVREVIQAMEGVLGRDLPVQVAQRRAGDVAFLVAQAQRIGDVLQWQPVNQDLASIIASSLAWERKLQKS